MGEIYGYYLHYRDIEDKARKQTGIDLKVADQIAALNKAGCNCEFIYCPQPESLLSMVKSCLPGFSDGVQWPDPAKVAKADFLYIRRPRFASRQFIAFVKAVKSFNPAIKIIYELPTYPYDSEMSNAKMVCALMKDRRHRRNLYRYIDRIADLSGAEEIFGIPTVQFYNGIDLGRISARNPAKIEGNTIRLLCIALFCEWHGVDRLIEGLAEYYRKGGQREIHLDLAGAGDSLPHLKKLTKYYELEPVVSFCGMLDSDELSKLYDRDTFAVASLALHRVGTKTASTLKTREYLAKGIPFVYAGGIDVFNREPLDCCLQVPCDDSPIDIQEVIDFYDSIYAEYDESTMTKHIRDYAERHVSIEGAMKGICEYIRS